MAEIPHASDLTDGNIKQRVARCTKKWARSFFSAACSKKWLSILDKRWSVPVDLAGIIGLHRTEWAIFLIQRLYLLEKKVRDAGLDFDWECI
ncbi:MAG: hypothetical protein ACK4ND_16575 [Cytophagaceae bacterium]